MQDLWLGPNWESGSWGQVKTQLIKINASIYILSNKKDDTKLNIYILLVHDVDQEVIDRYLESCKRKPAAATSADDDADDDDDDNGDEDDEQSKAEFEAFKKMMDVATPKSGDPVPDVPKPEPIMDSKFEEPKTTTSGEAQCSKCGVYGECEWISSTFIQHVGFPKKKY